MSPRCGVPKRNASVLMSTTSPSSIRGRIESPVTCGVRSVVANAMDPRSANCKPSATVERTRCWGETTERSLRARRADSPRPANRLAGRQRRMPIRLGGQNSTNAWPVNYAFLPFSEPLKNGPPGWAKPQMCESSELLRLSPIMK